MQDFVHLHVHTQYSLLDGQASVSRLVDKAMQDGMKGIAITDHGNMFGVKEFYNYVNKKNSGPRGEIKDLKKRIAELEKVSPKDEQTEAELAACRDKIAEAENKLFKPIIGCEMYVARRTMDKKEGKPDQSGWHLIVLAKNEKGYHNLIKLVSRAWTKGYYMRPRTDRSELEKYHEGLIVCSACLGGEVPKKITAEHYEEAEEAIQWYKNLFGEDYYLELQRHKATVPRANHEAYPLQQKVNAKLLEYAKKYNIKVICTNDVHFVDEENAEAHDHLICLSTNKDLDDPTRMLYTKQEWMKTKAEMNQLFEDVPEALSNTLEILDNASVRLREVPGLGQKRIKAIKKSWAENAEKRNAQICLQSLGITPAYFNRIYNNYGNECAEIIRKDQLVRSRYLIWCFLRDDSRATLAKHFPMAFAALRFLIGKGTLKPTLLNLSVTAQDLFHFVCRCHRKADALEPFFRFLRGRLTSMHFCGSPALGLTFEYGMAYLLLMFPIVIFLASVFAAQRKDFLISAEDVTQALILADHGFLRSKLFTRRSTKSAAWNLMKGEDYAFLMKLCLRQKILF